MITKRLLLLGNWNILDASYSHWSHTSGATIVSALVLDTRCYKYGFERFFLFYTNNCIAMKVFRFFFLYYIMYIIYMYRYCVYFFFNINGLVRSWKLFSEYTIGSAQSITSKNRPHENGRHQSLSLLFTLPNYYIYIYTMYT